MNINLKNLDEVMQERSRVRMLIRALNDALSDLDRALLEVGIEISQQSAGTDDWEG